MTEEIISELEHRSTEIIQSKKDREKSNEQTLGIYGTMTTDLRWGLTRAPEGQQKMCSVEKIIEVLQIIKAEDFTT